MTQLESAKNKCISPEMQAVAEREPLSADEIRKHIASGYTVILKSAFHDCVPVGIGKGLKIKINANLGTSNYNADPTQELEKLAVAVKYGADTVMDLSTGGDIRAMRRAIIRASQVPVGTVPVYEAIVRCPDVAGLTEDDFLDSIRRHIEDGVDFITVHCGVTLKCIPLLESRIMGVVSRGGSFLIKWMLHHHRENPLYTHYDEILDMAKQYDVVLSLGDGLRPGCLADATDPAQIEELKTLGELAARSQAKNVQVIVEGPGHVPLHMIKENVELQKKYCNGAPFYVLGPLVTDCSPGYDHLTGAIGGALAAYYGADFLCYLTPKEHLGLPDIQDVISRMRSNLNWEGMYNIALNPEKARAIRKETGKEEAEVCTMCGDFCSAKINRECREQYHK